MINEVIPAKAAKLTEFGNMTRMYTQTVGGTSDGKDGPSHALRENYRWRHRGDRVQGETDRLRTDHRPDRESRALVAAILPEEAEKVFAAVFAG